MSHPSAHADDEDHVDLKPRPRRPFELGSGPSTPSDDQPSSTFPPTAQEASTSTTPSRNRSFLNLTSSTLFGIYQPSGLGTDTVSATPFGDGTQTPAERRSFDFTRSNATFPKNAFTKSANGKLTRRRDTNSQRLRPRRTGFKNFLLPLAARLTALFLVGSLYGLLISHLHDRQHLAPATVALDRANWSYYAVWGVIGVVLGEALPWADLLWAEDEDSIEDEPERKSPRRVEGWLDAVRSIGLFVGIAFAIRKLPWQSTLQLSLTLALANPAIWYLIDRSPPGFIFSTLVAFAGTVLTLGINPALLPGPGPVEVLQGHAAKSGGYLNGTVEALKSEEFVLGIFSHESVGVATWVASVFFVSAVCFGNIGRRLAPSRI